jgi:hypothetical protein
MLTTTHLAASARALAVLCLLTLGVGGFRAWSPAPVRAGVQAAGYKTVHRFILASAAEEAELSAILVEFNTLFEAEGLPPGVYGLWRAEGATPATFLWESDWPDRATYDAVHAQPAYRALVQRHMARLGQLLQDHEYTRYREVSLP